MLDRIDRLVGNDFQRKCGVLLSAEDPTFASVDGAGGDMGNDGFLLVGTALYQAYAPLKREAAKVRRKIDESVAQVVQLRATSLRSLQRLVFLTPFDLTHEMHLYFQEATRLVGLFGDPWGESKLAGLLARHAEIRQLFPQFFLPDMAGDLRAIRSAVESVDDEPKRSKIEEAFGPDHEPDIIVLQKSDLSSNRDLQADEFFRVRVYSHAFRHSSFEPDEEDAFLGRVRGTFSEDATANLEPPTDDRVLVEHRHAELRFHRRWGWWTMGAIGMAGTLKDLHRDGMYSVADVAMDMTRFLILAGELGRERGGTGEARVLFGIDPGRLRVAFDPSDRIARERLGAHLRGVQSVARPALERPCGGTSVSATVSLEALPKLAVALTAQSLVAVLRKLHQARISTDEFEGSILPVVDAARRARTM